MAWKFSVVPMHVIDFIRSEGGHVGNEAFWESWQDSYERGVVCKELSSGIGHRDKVVWVMRYQRYRSWLVEEGSKPRGESIVMVQGDQRHG